MGYFLDVTHLYPVETNGFRKINKTATELGPLSQVGLTDTEKGHSRLMQKVSELENLGGSYIYLSLKGLIAHSQGLG